MTKAKILFTEDEPSLRSSFCEFLIESGYDCTAASNGKEAILELENDYYDVLVTDFKMPIMNGGELLNWCRNHGVLIPVIFISASVDLDPDEIAALEQFGTSIIHKPMGLNELVNAIESARRKHTRRNYQELTGAFKLSDLV